MQLCRVLLLRFSFFSAAFGSFFLSLTFAQAGQPPDQCAGSIVNIPTEKSSGDIAHEAPANRTVSSKNQSRLFPGKVLRLAGNEGIAYNGTRYADFQLIDHPRSHIPFIVSRSQAAPRARLVFLHGTGYSISNIGSVIPVARMFKNISDGGNGTPLATWFASQHPDLSIPVEVVAFDLPSAGWAPSLDTFPTAIDIAHYIQERIRDINEELGDLDTFIVCRSSSCAPSIIAGENIKGLVMTGATFPNPEVLDLNIQAIRRLEAQGEQPNWYLIGKVNDQFNDRAFQQRVNDVVRKRRLPILSLIGENDGETPLLAQQLWNDLINPGGDVNFRAQHVLPGAAHQVFLRPMGIEKSDFSAGHSDIEAFRLVLDFVRAQLERK